MKQLPDPINEISFRLRRAVGRHGIIGLPRVAAQQVWDLAKGLRPSVRANILAGEQRAHEFDMRFGVDTSGLVHPSKLAANHPNRVHAVSYGASDPRDVQDAIDNLRIDYSSFVFIDFGSGKGRVIMLASEFPFKRVLGVEFSEELHKIAQENISNFLQNRSRLAYVESICMDAVDLPLPDDDLVCYFCNPFDATLMTQMVARIRESFRRKSREIFILYYNAKEEHLFDQADCFEKVEADGWIRVWRTIKKAPLC